MVVIIDHANTYQLNWYSWLHRLIGGLEIIKCSASEQAQSEHVRTVTNVAVVVLALYVTCGPCFVPVATVKWSPSLSHPWCRRPEAFAIFPLKIQTIQRQKQPLDSHFPEKVTTVLDFLLCPPQQFSTN